MIDRRDRIDNHLNQSSSENLSNFSSVSPFNNQSKETEPNVRIYELAKGLNVDNQHVLAVCNSLGIEVTSHFNMISNSDVQRIHAAFRDYTTPVPPFNNQSKETEPNVRIYELAKELNVDNQHVLAICKSLGIEVASHLNMISTSDVQRIHTAFRDYATSGQSFDFSSEFIPKTETLKDEIISHKRLDPSRLQDLLAVGRWQEADQETEQLIIQIADAERQGLLGVEELKNLSCHDLRVIDRLWVEYSNGHFGFSVQKKIWESFGFTNNIRDYNIWWSFGNSVGWRVKDRWLPYERIKFTFQAPKGHLPFFRAWIGMRKTGLVYSMHQVNRFHAFMYRCGSCNLTQE
ncbi:translation initiation factor IF-2 N-terminal domain-containing protein [Nostoc sp. DedQUE09]|uniref:translation initiation factor IF-2 N-terminal domain-containing protein n=1 Tax=Nostoc sp. DedQUE09 TaxID=3075394 RepID=UPI002AD31489|nr:translation initiation factor IF-2 N-terminal domain-containing protein [Nostoc sp. DedQUE09]MDZ7954490.1 translation initiation factor IF-2 N-terminal domain-containing protein [Nostoc sp. DedQUE09]